MDRREYLAAAGTAGLTATAGCLSGLPVVSGFLCGPGETRIGDINDGGLAGETVEIRGKYDYTIEVGQSGPTAFRVDGETGTIPVFLADKSAETELDFGDCVTVRGVVDDGAEREVEGPVVDEASVV